MRRIFSSFNSFGWQDFGKLNKHSIDGASIHKRYYSYWFFDYNELAAVKSSGSTEQKEKIMEEYEGFWYSTTDEYKGRQPEHPAHTFLLENNIGSVENIIETLSESQTFCPFHIKNSHRTGKNWNGANLFPIDIDNGTTLEQAIERFKDQALLFFTTTNHQKLKKGNLFDRFVVIFALPGLVEQPIIISFLYLCAIAFLEHDEGAKSFIQGYHPGIDPIIIKFAAENRLNVIELANRYFAANSFEVLSDTVQRLESHRGLNAGSFGDMLSSYFESIQHHFPQSYKDYLELWKNILLSPRENPSSPKLIAEKRHRNLLRFDFPYFKSVCTLVQYIHLATFGELSHLAKNLLTIEGGRKHFLKITKNRPITDEDVFGSYKDLLATLRDASTVASTCKNNCKYYGKECQISPYNIKGAQRLKVGQVRRIEEGNSDFITLDDARTWLKTALVAAIQGAKHGR